MGPFHIFILWMQTLDGYARQCNNTLCHVRDVQYIAVYLLYYRWLWTKFKKIGTEVQILPGDRRIICLLPTVTFYFFFIAYRGTKPRYLSHVEMWHIWPLGLQSNGGVRLWYLLLNPTTADCVRHLWGWQVAFRADGPKQIKGRETDYRCRLCCSSLAEPFEHV